MKFRLDSKHRLRYKSTGYKILTILGKFLLFLFIVFLVFVGFTQTSYFRNLLKDEIIKLSRFHLKGELKIESIYGTLFSSLTIRKINYSIDGVEFISAKTLHVSINPLGLIQKKLIINKIFFENGHFNLIQFKDGKWITEKILKHPPKPDTTPSKKLDYEIILKSFILSDCQFRLKKNVDSSDYNKFTFYQELNIDDLTISNIDLNFSGRADFLKNFYELKIKEFDFKTNINGFSLERLRLNISLKNRNLEITPLEIETNKSNVSLNAYLKELDLNKPKFLENISHSFFNAKVIAKPFDFDDLYSLVPDVNMLKGRINVECEAEGSLKELTVRYLNANLDSTKLYLTGKVFNIDNPDILYINAKAENSEILMKDVSRLLPLYSIPEFIGLEKLKLNIHHEGSPLNFKTKFKIKTSAEEIDGLTTFNFQRRVPEYFVNLNTKNLGLSPLLKIDGKLNSHLTIKGEGFNPTTLKTELNFRVYQSSLAGNLIDSMLLKVEGKNRSIKFDFSTILEDAGVNLNGFVNFINEKLPDYRLAFEFKNFDPQKNLFVKELSGKLNLGGRLEGTGFDIDNMKANFALSIYESLLNSVEIAESKLLMEIDHSQKNKKINLSSDFVDAEITGNYKFTEILDMLTENFQFVEEEIQHKIKSFKGENEIIKEISAKNTKIESANKEGIKHIYSKQNLVYNFRFKDLNLINAILKNIKIKFDGKIFGEIVNDSSSFIIKNKGDIVDFWIVDREKSTRLKNTTAELYLNVDKSLLRNKVKLSTSIEAEKFLATSTIEDLQLQVDYDTDVFTYKIFSIVDTFLSVRSEGSFDVSTPVFIANIDKATVIYKKYKLTNQGGLNFSISKDKVKFDHFVLRRKKELYKLSGEINYRGEHDLQFSIQDLELFDLVLNFLPNAQEDINGIFSLDLKLNGTYDKPSLSGAFQLKEITIGNDELGEFTGSVDYKNKILNFIISYVDSVYEGDDLQLIGSLPIDLTLSDVKERISRKRNIEILITMNNFNLQPLKAIATIFRDVNGSLDGSLRIAGTLEKPEFYGSVNSKNMNFILAQNNLKYSSDISLKFTDNKISLQKFELSNLNTKKRGKLLTNAEVEIDERGIKYLKLVSTGSLLLLGNESRATGSKVYGDLFIETASPITIEGKYNDYNITGDINIRESSLVIPPIQSEYSAEMESFVYKYVDYSTQIDLADLAFLEAEKELRGKRKEQSKRSDGLISKLRGKVKISLKNNVSMIFIFSPELNQRLFADLKGEIFYNFTENQASAQGEIELTKDSYLVFYQRFLASGKIRFESDLSNPYLDVIASYANYYITGDTVNQKVKDVLIKLKLVGKVNELGKNLVSDRENMEVYIDGTLDKSKDASDIVAFILIGKFKDDLTAQDKTGALFDWGSSFQNAASSLLGSVITNFANNILGDVLRNVEFKRVGEETKFSLEGKVKDVRFKIGGGTDVFQNFALANIQIEYPMSDKLFLRLVRKQSQLQTSKQTEMINEVGLRYKVEF